MMQQHYTLNEPTVASQLIDGETILIHFDHGRYYSASGLGSELLELLLLQQTPKKLAGLLVAQYSLEPSVAEESVARYVETLLGESLIVPDARPRAPGNEPLDVRFASKVFEPPVLEMHAELEDLLRLDPLHDVDETGWPSVTANAREHG
jgi:hypothetical protein